MIAVIFEVVPAPGQRDRYLDIAASLKDQLQSIPGFISIERFQSLVNPDKVLSLSIWENENAVNAWRNTTVHREAQALGRNSVFADYRLRIASVMRDYGMHDRSQAPADSREYHDTRSREPLGCLP
jgi:heme-degrading monooxygenase HmoA